jgi:hypothetical protein
VPNPLQALSNLGRSTQDIGEAAKFFYGAAKSGLLGDDLARYINLGLRKAPQAGPIPTKPETAEQLLLTTRRAKGTPGAGQIQGRIPSTVKTTTPREVVRASVSPRIEDVRRTEQALRQVRPVEVAPGQLNIFESARVPERFSTPAAPGSAEDLLKNENLLRVKDPGTYQALSGLAERASRTLGQPVSVEDLMAPDWSQRISRLEPGAMVRSPGGATTPPRGSGGELAIPSRGGAVQQSPGGRIAQEPEIIAADIREIRTSPQIGRLSQEDAARAAAGLPSRSISIDTVPEELSRANPLIEALRNAKGGLQTMDLKRALAVGGLAGLGIGAAASRFGGNQSAVEGVDRMSGAPTGSPTAAADATSVAAPPASPGGQTPGTLSVPGGSFVQAGGGATPPAGPVPGMTGAGQVVIRTDDSASELRQAVQRVKAQSPMAFTPDSPQNYKKIAEYYGARQKYAGQPEVAASVQRQLVERGSLGTPDLKEWAAKNPVLAYEMLQKEMGSRPVPSMQMAPMNQGVSLGSELGTNNANNAVGYADNASASAVYGSQGASDLADAAKPIAKPQLLSPQEYEAVRLGYLAGFIR